MIVEEQEQKQEQKQEPEIRQDEDALQLQSGLESLSMMPFSSASSTTTIMNTSSLVLDLPLEIHDLILSYLPWPSLLALRHVHKIYSATLIPLDILSVLHTEHVRRTHRLEHYHLQTELGYSNANWTGFTQGWGLSQRASLSTTLPCYHCLRWLPSTDVDLITTAFSRGMATGKTDLAMANALKRICLNCGIRSGFYKKGTKVAHRIVCRACGGLGERICRSTCYKYRSQLDGDGINVDNGEMVCDWDLRLGQERDESSKRSLMGWPLRWHYFCKRCIEQGLSPRSALEFEHERRWAKYERGLVAGQEHRAEKGKQLRHERGVNMDDAQQKKKFEKVSQLHICPIMKEKRRCDCWRTNTDWAHSWSRKGRYTLAWKW